VDCASGRRGNHLQMALAVDQFIERHLEDVRDCERLGEFDRALAGFHLRHRRLMPGESVDRSEHRGDVLLRHSAPLALLAHPTTERLVKARHGTASIVGPLRIRHEVDGTARCGLTHSYTGVTCSRVKIQPMEERRCQ